MLLLQLKRCELAEYNATIHDLIIDFELLLEMSKMLPKEGARRYQALYTANDMVKHLIVVISSFVICSFTAVVLIIPDQLPCFIKFFIGCTNGMSFAS